MHATLGQQPRRFASSGVWLTNPIMENLEQIMRLVDQGFRNLHVVVAGDVMLDKYLWGDVDRISPEAPVPIVRVAHRREQPGGAANVAMNLATLGAAVTLIGFAGGDPDQAVLEHLLVTAGVECRLTTSETAPTTSKLRIVGGNQQMMRIDIESHTQRPAAAYDDLLHQFIAALPVAHVVILSDYAKGTLTPPVCESMIQAALGAGVPILVDPKSRDFGRYRQATTICPNLGELSAATGVPARDMEAVLAAGQRLVADLGLQFLTVTLSEKGIAVLYPECRVVLPAVARNVFDVSGAGDTVIATLALAVAAQIPIENAAELANVAAGVVVGKVGTVPIQKHELIAALSRQIAGHAEAKLLNADQLLSRTAAWRLSGEKLVFTNGCFDILHLGHISLLNAARRQGDRLIVGINSDASIRRLKGAPRPLVAAGERAQVLCALAAVDCVVIFDEDTPLALINAIRPDVLVKGGDFTEATVVGAPEMRSWGGAVRLVPLVKGISTSEMIARAFSFPAIKTD